MMLVEKLVQSVWPDGARAQLWETPVCERKYSRK